MGIQIAHANILDWAASYDGPLFHALLCDPPYHLTSGNAGVDWNAFQDPGPRSRNAQTNNAARKGFMGKSWDGGDIAYQPATWAALGKLLHPGAFLMAFAGSRGYHRMACAIEDAGFIIHPAIGWAFGSGFPKATRVDTQVDRRAGVERAKVGSRKQTGAKFKLTQELIDNGGFNDPDRAEYDITAPATELAQAWQGHRYGGQALKPAFEFICVAQKPYAGRPVDSITATGAGALWIDGARIGTEVLDNGPATPRAGTFNESYHADYSGQSVAGRWPANLILQHVYLPVMRLKDIIPLEVTEVIWRYFNGYDRVRNVRESRGIIGLAQEPQTTFLQSDMRRSVQAGSAQETVCNDRMPDVSSDIRGASIVDQKRPEEILQPGMQESLPIRSITGEKQPSLWQTSSDERQSKDSERGAPALIGYTRAETSGMEGRETRRPRVHKSAHLDTERERSGTGSANGSEERDIHSRTPTCDGTHVGSPTETNRDRTSHEWRQAGQPTRKSDDDGERSAFEGTPEDRSGIDQAPRGESPLEVFADDIPPGWIGYFEPTGEDLGCQPIGTRRVKGSHLDHTCSSNSPQLANLGTKHKKGHTDADGMETIPDWRCHPDCAVYRLGVQSGESTDRNSRGGVRSGDNDYFVSDGGTVHPGFNGDTGTAARFFFQSDYLLERLEDADAVAYYAKSSRAEREAGLDPRQVKLINSAAFDEQKSSPIYGNETAEGAAARGRRPRHGFDLDTINDGRAKSIDNPYQRGETTRRNIHPTLKPLALARHLATLLLPPDLYAPRRLLIPFSGAGSEMIGALLAGWEDIQGVELEADHVRIAEARIAYWQQRRHEFLDPSKPITAQLVEAPDGQLDLFDLLPPHEPFTESFEEWYAKTKDYGGTYEEWQRLSEGENE